MVELCQSYESQETVASACIAGRRQIPEKYLVHILLQLKRAGLVRSVRGAQGGYILSRGAEQITLLDIVEAIDGPVLDPIPASENGGESLSSAWKEVALRIEAVLQKFTLRQIADGASVRHMYYI